MSDRQAGLFLFHRQDHAQKVAQGVRQPRIGELVSHLAALWATDDESAASKTGDVVADVGAGQGQVGCEIG